MDLGDALAWLDRHQNLERMLADSRTQPPTLERLRRLMDAMGDPQRSCPVIHITGTNGKTSTARAVTQLLLARGVTVGTFTSPHLEAINERICANGEPIPDDDLAEVLSDVAGLEDLLGERLTWFEALTAAAYRYFADRPVDVAVMEVGLGGRWDATNVADASVAVVTNIGLDHVEFLGSTRESVAREKAGIVRKDAPLVLGETEPGLVEVFEEEHPAQLILQGRDFGCSRNVLAVGGRSLDLQTPLARYDGVWLDLHGRHQAENFAVAAVATEAFFAAPTPEAVVREAAGSVRSPGRMEVMSRRPLVVLDGAKNIEGARSAARTIAEEFGGLAGKIMVVGMLAGKDPGEMLDALEVDLYDHVVVCPPPSPRAQPPEVVAGAIRSSDVAVHLRSNVPDAIEAALGLAGDDDLVLVTGSLYVVGAARAVLHGRLR